MQYSFVHWLVVAVVIAFWTAVAFFLIGKFWRAR